MGTYVGSGAGNSGSAKVTLEKPIMLVSGHNTIDLLSLTVGLQVWPICVNMFLFHFHLHFGFFFFLRKYCRFPSKQREPFYFCFYRMFQVLLAPVICSIWPFPLPILYFFQLTNSNSILPKIKKRFQLYNML